MKKVRPGEAWRPSAARDNAAVDAAEWVRRHEWPQAAGRQQIQPEPDMVRVANPTCGDAWEEYEVVELDKSLVKPARPGWREGLPALRARTPTVTGGGKIAILTAPAPQCRIVTAIASGVARTIVNVTDSSHRFARAVAGSRRLQSTSSTAAPCEILWKEPGTGERYALVRISNAGTAPTTATTSGGLGTEIAACVGKCKWISTDGVTWDQQPTNGCSFPTTTTPAPPTTTTGSGSTSTTGGPTTTTTACCPNLQDDPTSTTTAAEDPEPCECAYPTYCPSAPGECTYTQCVQGANNTMPDCGPTTTTTPGDPITSTTCDCGSVVAPDPCTAGCDWVGLPSGSGGNWAWHRTYNGCASDCPCPPPDWDPFCATAHTGCVLQPPPPPPPPPPGCSGSCTWVWIESIGQYYRTSHSCNTLAVGCDCQPPSDLTPCAALGCCTVDTPCVSPPAAPTTTTTTTRPYDPCQYLCLGGTTTTPGPVTTTTAVATCANAGCRWESDALGTGWSGPYDSTCPSGCPCIAPSRAPYDTCESIYVGCYGTTTPGTTTTGAPTTTTTNSCTGVGMYECQDGGWVSLYSNCGGTCNGTCGLWEEPSAACSESNVGQQVWVPCSCLPPLTTTTTAAPPTTSTTSGPTTTTTAAPPTTSTTEPGTSTTPPENSCLYQCDGQTETWQLIAANCNGGNTCQIYTVCDMMNDGQYEWSSCGA